MLHTFSRTGCFLLYVFMILSASIQVASALPPGCGMPTPTVMRGDDSHETIGVGHKQQK